MTGADQTLIVNELCQSLRDTMLDYIQSGDVPAIPSERIQQHKIGEQHMTIADIKQANRDAGQHYFDRSTMRFFDSKVETQVYEGPGGVYFVTSEQFHGSQGSNPRKWTVRQFNPENGHCWTPSEIQFNTMNRLEAKQTAARLAKGIGLEKTA